MMTKINILLISIVLLCSVACKEELDEPNEITVSGDYSGRLVSIIPNITDDIERIRATSIEDSSSISYPSFLLELNSNTGIFYVREAQEEDLIRYYIIDHGVSLEDPNYLRVEELKLLRGEGIFNEAIVNKDDSQSIILNGKIQR
ncbi:MAG: hypothetical protein ACFB0B_10125 [Thermonemataceae bacterium]